MSISRVDSNRTHCYWVRVVRGYKVHSASFSDKKCGGGGRAHELAKRYEARLIKALPPAQMGRHTRGSVKLMVDNRGGVYVLAKYSHNYTIYRKQASLKLYGYNRAWDLCTNWLKQREQ